MVSDIKICNNFPNDLNKRIIKGKVSVMAGKEFKTTDFVCILYKQTPSRIAIQTQYYSFYRILHKIKQCIVITTQLYLICMHYIKNIKSTFQTINAQLLTHVPRAHKHRDNVRLILLRERALHQLQKLAESLSFL